MNKVETFQKQQYSQPSSASSAGPVLRSDRGLLTIGLLILCAALHTHLSAAGYRSVKQASDQVRLGAALPAESVESESRWRHLHSGDRHYARVSSRAGTSELNFLCIDSISCGWVLKLNDETHCNSEREGEKFRVRVASARLVRDFQSRCSGYGLVLLGTESGENHLLTDLVETSDTLQISSVGNAGMFATQHYNSQGAKKALNAAMVAAGL